MKPHKHELPNLDEYAVLCIVFTHIYQVCHMQDGQEMKSIEKQAIDYVKLLHKKSISNEDLAAKILDAGKESWELVKRSLQPESG